MLEKVINLGIASLKNIKIIMTRLTGIKNKKNLSIILNQVIALALILMLAGCEHLEKIETKGDVSGTRYSDDPFLKSQHNISASYPISETIRLKSKISQSYLFENNIDANLTDYGETSLEFLF